MDAVNLLIGTVLFVVVMIVLVTNSRQVSDLKKSIKNSTSDSSASISNMNPMLVRDKEGIFAPKRAYYVSPAVAANAPVKGAADVDQIILPFNKLANYGALELAKDIQEGRCKVLYRPETRILYKITTFSIHDGNSSFPTPTSLESNTSAFNYTEGSLLVNLKRNLDTTSSTNPMFSESERGSGKMRTIIGLPCEMSGNMASGI